MMLAKLRTLVRQWDLKIEPGVSEAIGRYAAILDQLEHHAQHEWRVYLPAEHTDFKSNYMDRLAAWIGNVANEDDQKLLLEYALHISFFSQDDFFALYHTAMNREVMRWVASQTGASLKSHGGAGFHDAVSQEIHHHTWFCPITDSMDINEFYKVNHLSGIGHRPGFATIEMIAKSSSHIDSALQQYMQQPSKKSPALKRIVLLEDIVGSGSQCLKAVQWVVANLGKPVLFIPLILCPNGLEALRIEESNSDGWLSVRPIITLSRGDLLGPERRGHPAWAISERVEKLANRYASRASHGIDTFGYKNTGSSLATFSNTPDNTLPLVHHKPLNGSWEPLFPRVFRD